MYIHESSVIYMNSFASRQAGRQASKHLRSNCCLLRAYRATHVREGLMFPHVSASREAGRRQAAGKQAGGKPGGRPYKSACQTDRQTRVMDRKTDRLE